MHLDKLLREQMTSEFRVAIAKMAEAPDLATKLFFYSALYGETQRILNRQWDADLALVHLVLSSSYAAANARLTAVRSGSDIPISIPAALPDALVKTATELTLLLENNNSDREALMTVLARLAELAYVQGGNGYYLYLKGHIKV